MKRGLPNFLVFLIFVAVYCGLALWLPRRSPEYFADMARTIPVTINSGMTARAAATAIEEAGAVDSAALLVDSMAALGIDKTLKAGVYELKKGTAANVAMQLKNAKPLSLAATLIPGCGIDDAARSVGGMDALLAALADDALFPEEVRAYLPEEAKSRIVFLLPETYFLVPGADAAAQLVRRASLLWYERVGKGLPLSLSPQDVLKTGVLASIVEGEAKAADERPVLAGIFIKRLKLNMRLQSCATVVYSWALKGEKKQKLTYKDLKINSDYNTYKRKGLPPGPICIPSRASWESALDPTDTDYLFFFADSEGRHYFSKTYKEHMNKQKAHSSNGF